MNEFGKETLLQIEIAFFESAPLHGSRMFVVICKEI
jgi:hypothetical protein